MDWTRWLTARCGGRIKKQLLCHRCSQLSNMWRPQRAKSPRLNFSSLGQQEVVYDSVFGKGVSVLQLQGWFWAVIIPSQIIVVIVVMSFSRWLFGACIIWVQNTAFSLRSLICRPLKCYYALSRFQLEEPFSMPWKQTLHSDRQNNNMSEKDSICYDISFSSECKPLCWK